MFTFFSELTKTLLYLLSSGVTWNWLVGTNKRSPSFWYVFCDLIFLLKTVTCFLQESAHSFETEILDLFFQLVFSPWTVHFLVVAWIPYWTASHLMGSFFGPLQNLFWFLITRKLTKMQTFCSRKNSMKMLATLRLTFVRFPAKYNVFSSPQLVVFLLRKGNEKLSRSNVFFSTRVNGFLERGPSRHPGTLETVFSELSSGFCSPFVFFEDFTEYFPETMG